MGSSAHSVGHRTVVVLDVLVVVLIRGIVFPTRNRAKTLPITRCITDVPQRGEELPPTKLLLSEAMTIEVIAGLLSIQTNRSCSMCGELLTDPDDREFNSQLHEFPDHTTRQPFPHR